jgi:hypothetical protein
VFCILNGRDLSYTVDDAERLLVAAAAGELDVPDLATWRPGSAPTARDAVTRCPGGHAIDGLIALLTPRYDPTRSRSRRSPSSRTTFDSFGRIVPDPR